MVRNPPSPLVTYTHETLSFGVLGNLVVRKVSDREKCKLPSGELKIKK